MKYKRIIKKIMAEDRPYDSFYPEHKPISQKMAEMERDEDYLLKAIIRNKRNIPTKAAQFAGQIKTKNKFYFWYEVLLWNLDFDFIEEYCWHRASKNFDRMLDSKLFEELLGKIDNPRLPFDGEH